MAHDITIACNMLAISTLVVMNSIVCSMKNLLNAEVEKIIARPVCESGGGFHNVVVIGGNAFS